jgi:hypothetical protein
MKAHDGSGTLIPRHPDGVLTPLRLLVHRLLQVPVRAGVPENYEEHQRQGLSGRHRELLVWRSAVKHRPADVVPQPLVIEHQLANRLRELGALPRALESACGFTFGFRRGSTSRLDRLGGRAERVRGDGRDGPGLASRVRGRPRCPT